VISNCILLEFNDFGKTSKTKINSRGASMIVTELTRESCLSGLERLNQWRAETARKVSRRLSYPLHQKMNEEKVSYSQALDLLRAANVSGVTDYQVTMKLGSKELPAKTEKIDDVVNALESNFAPHEECFDDEKRTFAFAQDAVVTHTAYRKGTATHCFIDFDNLLFGGNMPDKTRWYWKNRYAIVRYCSDK